MDIAKHLAESLREVYLKLKQINEITSWEVYEAFPTLSNIDDIFLTMVSARHCDHNNTVFFDYATGEIDYDTMLKVLWYE